jgi:hypothetical protein
MLVRNLDRYLTHPSPKAGSLPCHGIRCACDRLQGYFLGELDSKSEANAVWCQDGEIAPAVGAVCFAS